MAVAFHNSLSIPADPLEKLIVAQLVKISRLLWNLKVHPPCSYEPTISPFPEPDDSYPPHLFHKINFNSILPFSLRSSELVLPIRICDQIMYTFLFCPMRAVCLAFPILDLIMRIISYLGKTANIKFLK
jgi:hypothetical protein